MNNISKREQLILAFANTPMAKTCYGSNIKQYVEDAAEFADAILSLDVGVPSISSEFVCMLHGKAVFKTTDLLTPADYPNFESTITINASDIDTGTGYGIPVWEVLLRDLAMHKYYKVA